MPFINEEDLVDLNKKIDDLEERRTKLDQLNDVYLEEIKDKKVKVKVLVLLSLFFLMAFIVVLLLYAGNKHQTQGLLSDLSNIKKDTIFIEKEKIIEVPQKVTSHAVSFGVQIGGYRNFNVSFDSCIQKFLSNGNYVYVFGNFEKIEQAEYLKLLLEDLEMKGTFVVRMEHGELVN